jgi:hypothetical protein
LVKVSEPINLDGYRPDRLIELGRRPTEPIAFNSHDLKAGHVIIQLYKMSQGRRKDNRCKFKPEEDQKLREFVNDMKDQPWDFICQKMKSRNARQYRERWKHYLSAMNPSQPWPTMDSRR